MGCVNIMVLVMMLVEMGVMMEMVLVKRTNVI